MSDGIQVVGNSQIAEFLPGVESGLAEAQARIFEENRHRIYSFAFWMTDHELEAERLRTRTFKRAFEWASEPSEALIDEAFLHELRRMTPIGRLSLGCEVQGEIASIRRNTRRVLLERAIVQLPGTERLIFCMHDGEGYSHERVAEMLGITKEESQQGLHAARLRIRELLSEMRF